VQLGKRKRKAGFVNGCTLACVRAIREKRKAGSWICVCVRLGKGKLDL